MLSVGWKGLNLFCRIMDLGSSISDTLYYGCLHNIYEATKSVYNKVTTTAVKEEKQANVEHEKPIEFTVSGDWTWKKRGLSSLFGVATVTGKYSKKVLDAEIMSSFCQDCNIWKNKLNTEEFHNWIEEHEEKCINDRVDNARKLEVDAMTKIFLRSEKKYGIRYTTYIDDGDNKVFKVISKIKSYDDGAIVTKKECVDNVTKNMCIRL